MKIERMLDHAAYLDAHRDRVAASHLKALREGATDPVVLLLDPEDEAARAIAEESGEAAAIAAHVAEGRRRGFSSSLTWGMPRAVAVALLAEIFPEVAEVVAVPGEDSVYSVVVVAEGSASAILMPPIKEAGA